MPAKRAFGQQFGDCFGLKTVKTIKAAHHSGVAVTRLTCAHADNGMSAPLQAEEAFLLTVQLQDCAHHELWIDGEAQPTTGLKRGALSIYDLRRSPVVYSTSPFQNLHIYLPLRVINETLAADDCKPINGLVCDPGRGVEDPVMRGLALSLEQAFRCPARLNDLFLEHVAIAATLHVSREYGSAGVPASAPSPSLTLRQRQMAIELLSQAPPDLPSLAVVADTLGMTLSRFRSGFLQATGMLPHEWILDYRLRRAQALLLNTDLPLEEIADACGFMDSRHLGRVITSNRGMTPESIRLSGN
jgi:AraC family transcriptional regulator